ncbi:MAG: hypothetical protein H7293_17970 [Candidatus Saccharibacteria bacterium]|nr:hypothetical protein [Rhodoferax sp.]
MVLNLFLLTPIGFAMSYWSSWWPLLPSAALVFGVWLFFVHLRPMQLTTPYDQSSALGKAAVVDVVASVVVGIASS